MEQLNSLFLVCFFCRKINFVNYKFLFDKMNSAVDLKFETQVGKDPNAVVGSSRETWWTTS